MTDLNLITVGEITTLAPDLNIASYDSPTLSGLISGASKQVSDYLGYSPYAENIVNEVRQSKITSEGDLLIYPVKVPVQSVSAISITKGTAELTVTLTNGQGENRYNIDFAKRNIRVPYGDMTLQGNPVLVDIYALRNTNFYTKVSYRGGFEVSELPQTFKTATILYLRDQLSVSLNSSGATRISQGGISLEFASTKGKSDLILDAERLLAPYRRNI